jgi:plastocyanin
MGGRPALIVALTVQVTVATLLAACRGPAGTVGPAPSAPSGGVAVVAADMAFDRGELAIPAGRPFPLLFENRDGAPHNIRILAANSGDTLFVGEIFSGPGSRTYALPAIPAGAYRFRCDVHPAMAGEVVAR